MAKLKKVWRYARFRIHELRVSLKEFSKGSKLNKRALQTFKGSSMLVSAHSVEKGLGLRNAGPGHSGAVVDMLLNKLLAIAKSAQGTEDFSFRETLRVVMAYMDFQEQFDTSQFELYGKLKTKYEKLSDLLGNDYMCSLRSSVKAGAAQIPAEEMSEAGYFDFEKFISTRHSIRAFDKAPLPKEAIIKAVEIAGRAPSACNRQPSYVYFCSEPAKVSKIDELITGSSGFKGEVPNYIIVTTDRACFSYVEQYQWYINGGIFLSYLSLALHSEGIGHCIMQWKAFYKTEGELKKLLGISDTEAIIAVVGCGYADDNASYLMAQRKGAEEILRIVGQ